MKISLMFFASEQSATGPHYNLQIQATLLADAKGFEAVWFPERHFSALGGLFPNPMILCAALATRTSRIHLRAGSVVAPLHDNVRLVEDWSMLAALAPDRVGVAFASGWSTVDYSLAPRSYSRRREITVEMLREFQELWRTRRTTRLGGTGGEASIFIHPLVENGTLPLWLTSGGSPATFEAAGETGANLLTHLLGADLDQLQENLALYRSARTAAGWAGAGSVTLMLHTFLSASSDQARSIARPALRNYLVQTSEQWQFLTQKKRVMAPSEVLRARMLDAAVDRYLTEAGLFGSPEDASKMVQRLASAGVDEIACLIDFGLDDDTVMTGLEQLALMKDRLTLLQ